MFSSTEEPSLIKIRERQLSFGRLMLEINRKIAAGDSYASILSFLFDCLDKLIPYDRIGVALIDGERLCSKWMKSKLPGGHLDIGYCATLKNSSLKQVLDTGQPRIINDLVEYSLQKPDSDSTRRILKDGIRSSLTCPVYASGIPIGIVFFSSAEKYTYRSEHIDTYLEIADEISFVIGQDKIRRQAAGVKSTNQNVRMLLHDLKSPLSVIQGFLQIAMVEHWYEGLDHDAKGIFATLKRNTVHMQNLLTELAELSQIGTAEDGNETKEVVLKEFLCELGAVSRDLAAKKSIEFALEYANDLPDKIIFDPLRVRRVLDNLISNAVKFSNRKTTIRLLVRWRNDRIYFDVIDQGLGIAGSEIPKLFKEFGKTSTRPTEGESSSGLGLAIVKKIVEQQGGQIAVSSEINKGSTFSFWIPSINVKS